MSRGIVVDHKETGVRYAISEHNFNDKVHAKVRDLKPGETVIGYRPRRKESLAGRASGLGSPSPANDQAPTPGDARKTEGSPAGGTKEAK